MKQVRQYHQESFDERYRKMTVYLSKAHYHELQYRREQGKITNVTAFFQELLDRAFQQEK